MTPIELVLSRLPDAKKKGKQWSARCPAHEDKTASLSVAEGDDGRVLLHCHAGCEPIAVWRALGIQKAELFPRRDSAGGGNGQRIVATYDYKNETGELLFQVVRYAPKDFRQRRPDGRGGWTWNLQGKRRVLYRLPELLKAAADSWTFAVEGEKDADRLGSLGLTATTNPGGAGKWAHVDDKALHGRRACILADNDDAGRRHARDVATRLHAKADVRIVELPGLPPKGDVSDWLDAGHTAAELFELAESAARYEPADAPSDRGAVTVRVADVVVEPVEWLWPGRFPLGKVSLLAGDPCVGKSVVSLDIAARVSRGVPWPDRRDEPNPPRGVVIVSAEDDLNDTIRPRLDVAGADVSRIVALRGVRYTDDDGAELVRSFTLADLPALEGAIRQTPDCRLVIIDPVTAYFPAAGVDSHKNTDVRGLLAPLADLAARFKVAVVCVTHLSKAPGRPAMYRAMGSLAFVAAARAAWLFVADKNDPARRLILGLKNNLAPDGTGLAYRIEPGGGAFNAPIVAWEAAPVTMTANDALAASEAMDRSVKRDEAVEWLRSLLASGPMPVGEIREEVKEAGFSWRTVRRAKDALRITPKKHGFECGRWSWELPPEGGQRVAHEGGQPLTRESWPPLSGAIENAVFGGQDSEGVHVRMVDTFGDSDALCVPDSDGGADCHLDAPPCGAAPSSGPALDGDSGAAAADGSGDVPF